MKEYLKQLILKDSASSSKRAVAILASFLLSLTVGRILWIAEIDKLLILASMLISFILTLLGITIAGDNRRKRIESEQNPDNEKSA